jgi:hypothetical protein
MGEWMLFSYVVALDISLWCVKIRQTESRRVGLDACRLFKLCVVR